MATYYRIFVTKSADQRTRDARLSTRDIAAGFARRFEADASDIYVDPITHTVYICRRPLLEVDRAGKPFVYATNIGLAWSKLHPNQKGAPHEDELLHIAYTTGLIEKPSDATHTREPAQTLDAGSSPPAPWTQPATTPKAEPMPMDVTSHGPNCADGDDARFQAELRQAMALSSGTDSPDIVLHPAAAGSSGLPNSTC